MTEELTDKQFIQGEINHIRESINKHQQLIDDLRKAMKQLISIKKQLK